MIMNDWHCDLIEFDKEIAPLLQSIFRSTGIDYRNYSKNFLTRRILAFARKQNCATIEEVGGRVLNDEAALRDFANTLSLPTTRMFRDAGVFQQLRNRVIPFLEETQLAKVWSAGCSTGEEAYSLAIVFKEERPPGKTLIFATDCNEKALIAAKKGIFPLRHMRAHTFNYLASGGKGDFSNYYSADHENAMMNEELKHNIVFAQHNLASDYTFNEFDLILCRNVLIYFNGQLQQQVLDLLYKSLRPGGILILGDKESLRSVMPTNSFVDMDRALRIFKKIQ